MINIPVSNNFNNQILNDILLKNDTKINENILNLGTNMYIKENEILSKIYYDDKINDIINKFKNDKVEQINAFIQNGKDLAAYEFNKIIDIHINNINELKNKNNLLENNLFQINNKLIEINNNKNNDKYTLINSNLEVIHNKFSSYFDKIFKDNTTKGIFGENFIQNYLTDKFSNSRIINTTKETASGDLLFIFDNLKILIESKNVQNLKKDDIDKFYRDVDIKNDKNEINSAILISLNDTNLVNGERYFHFEIRNKLPVIMISNVFNNPEFIRIAILTLHFLIKNHIFNKDDIINNNEKIELLISYFHELFDNIKKQITHLNNDKIIIQKLQESYHKRENDILNTDKIFSNILLKFPQLNNNNTYTNDESLQNIIHKIKTKINEDPLFIINNKNLENIGISIHNIKKIGGIKKINNHFNNINL